MGVPDRAARLVDGHAAARAERQAGRAGELVARPDSGREHHYLGVYLGAVGQFHAGRPPRVRVGHDPDRRRAAVRRHAKAGDQAGEQRAAALVDLHRHQVRRELDDVRREPEQPQRVGRLKPEQPAADHDAGRPAVPAAAVRIASRSSSVRYTKHPGAS